MNKIQHLSQGLSFWSIKTREGLVIKESQKTVSYNGLLRQKDWGLDVVNKDIKNIEEIFLHTPKGIASLEISLPYTAFQFKFGTQSIIFGEKIRQGQIIGRVDNISNGDCTCAIWDILEQELYIDHCTNVREFTPWREGSAKFGAMSLDVIGV